MKSIIVVGGGSAGWMTAAFLNAVLRNPEKDEPMPITVIESDQIGTIGVGESTVPTLRNFLQVINVPEWQFLRDTNATFKGGIQFSGWTKSSATGSAAEYFHPFETPPVLFGHSAMTHWLALRDRGFAQLPFSTAVGIQAALSHNFKSSKPAGSAAYESPLPYAYNLDAANFGDLLRTISTARGVRHVRDHVTAVHKTETGDISHLSTREHGGLKADFYIDASGFRSILLGGALEEPFEDWTDYLLCDRAVACQIPHVDKEQKLRPYTTSTAKAAGWIWEIDLYSRRGNGYVYSSKHIDPQEAERTLREHLGDSCQEAPVRHLSMMIGHRRRMWARNCLAVGLAAGFLEPLESTGIYFVEAALSLFVEQLADGAGSAALATRFNTKMSEIYSEVRDFLQLHYILSDRDDTAFWCDYRREVKRGDSLEAKLELWAHRAPSDSDLAGRPLLFGPANYSYILAGLNQLAPSGNALSAYLNPAVNIRALGVIEQARKHLLATSPDHREYLKKQRSAG